MAQFLKCLPQQHEDLCMVAWTYNPSTGGTEQEGSWGLLASLSTWWAPGSVRDPAKTAWWVKVLTHKPDNLGSSPRTHIVEGKEQTFKVVLWPTHVCKYTPNKIIFKNEVKIEEQSRLLLHAHKNMWTHACMPKQTKTPPNACHHVGVDWEVSEVCVENNPESVGSYCHLLLGPHLSVWVGEGRSFTSPVIRGDQTLCFLRIDPITGCIDLILKHPGHQPRQTVPHLL